MSMPAPRSITSQDITPLYGASAKAVWESNCLLGESVLWDSRKNQLFFLDIKGGELFELPLRDFQARQRWSVPDMVSSLALSEDGRLFGTSKFGLVEILIPESETDVIDLKGVLLCGAGAAGNRFNDGKASPDGTYWAGVMDDAETGQSLGALWRFGKENVVTTILDNMLVPNGPAFHPSGTFAYFADSARLTLFRVNIGLDGSPEVPVPVLIFSEGLGYPDGMTFDGDGNLWVAFWDGGCIRRFSPDLSKIEELILPVPRPTSIAITSQGLFVTSARIGLNQESFRKSPLSGSLFQIEGLDVPVGPDYRYAVFKGDEDFQCIGSFLQK